MLQKNAFLLVFVAACAETASPVTPPVLSFEGSKAAALTVTVSGSWTIASDQPWLTLSKPGGEGNGTVTATVNRSGLASGNYSAKVTFTAQGQTKVVPVFMRFPIITGNVSGRAHQRDVYVPSFESSRIVPDVLEILLDAGAVAVVRGLTIDKTSDPAPSAADFRAVADALAKDYGLTIEGSFGAVFEVKAGGRDLKALHQKLSVDGRVASAGSVSQERSLQVVPNDPMYAQQWHYPLINLPQAWAVTTGSANVPVAVVDTGVEVTHPDLQSRVGVGYDFTRNSEQMTDADGHGTHCAGTIGAATNNGVLVAGVTALNPLIPVRVLGDDGTGSGANIGRGLVYAAGLPVQLSNGQTVQHATGARVINASLGANDPQCTGNPAPSPTHFEIVRQIEARGVVLVFAAGNDGPCNRINEWGAIPGVISVTAVGPDGLRAPYSTAGETAWIAAPGGLAGGAPNGVLSTYTMGGTRFVEGTSMAAPHVAGVVALMLSVNPALTPLDVRTILSRTARPIAGADMFSSGAPNQRGGMGYGLVDAFAAVTAAQSWQPAQSNFRAQLVNQGGMVVQTVPVDQGGNFAIRGAASGSYTLRVGNDPDNDSVLGEAGEEFDQQPVTLGEDADTAFDASLHHM